MSKCQFINVGSVFTGCIMFASNAKIFSEQFNPPAGIREVLERKSLNLEISLSTESSMDEQIQAVSFCVGTGISPNSFGQHSKFLAGAGQQGSEEIHISTLAGK